jgi:hypothetical protein
MSTAIQAPSPALEAAAHNAGLNLTAAEPGIDFTGVPTTRALVTLTGDAGFAADPARQQLLELRRRRPQILRRPRRLLPRSRPAPPQSAP